MEQLDHVSIQLITVRQIGWLLNVSVVIAFEI